MSSTAISRPSISISFLILLFIHLTVAQFPDQFELNSFLYNAPPKSFEADFFRGPRGVGGHKNSAAAKLMSSPGAAGALRSQNRKFLAKTPEHDKHFATILRQQEAATIKDPSQAAMVADDQLVLRGRGVSHSLQTSDDDVYEVESAPMEMKSRLPYRPRGAPFHHNPSMGGRHRGFMPPNPHFQAGYHRRAQMPEMEASEPEENDGEGGDNGGDGNEQNNGGVPHTGVPVSVSFESNIDHSAYEAPEQPDQPEQPEQRHNQRGNDDDDWASPRHQHKIMPLEGEPEEFSFNSGSHNRGQSNRPHSTGMGQQKMHFSMGVANDEGNSNGHHQHNGESSSYRPPARPNNRGNPHGSSSSFQHQQQPYTHIQYMHMMPASANLQSSPEEHKRGGYRGPGSYSHSSPSSDEFRSPDWGPSPALHEQSRAQHEREIFGAPPVPGSKLDLGKAPMESSWLDMGAYSSGKGAFGWYSDVPVAGGGGGNNGGGHHQIMHKK